MIELPIGEKSNLIPEEAAACSSIGINKSRKMSDKEDCPFVLWIGSKQLINSRRLDEYVDQLYRFAPNPLLDNKTVFDYTQVEHGLLSADREELLWQTKDRQKKIKTELFFCIFYALQISFTPRTPYLHRLKHGVCRDA